MLRVRFVVLKSSMFLNPSGDFNDYSLDLTNESKCTRTNTTEFSKKNKFKCTKFNCKNNDHLPSIYQKAMHFQMPI